MFSDFNAVRRFEERVNSTYCPAIADEFNSFIHNVELHDFNMGRERYTYMTRVDAKLSKLDRFLACSDFLEAFPSLVVIAHPRELSYHSLITMISHITDYRPPPFKLFNSWLLKEGFDNIVKEAWGTFVKYGEPNVYLGAKLKYLNDEIKNGKTTS